MQRATLLASLLFLALPVPAQNVTVDEVLLKNLEATGGADAWRGVRSLHTTGQVTVDTQVGPIILGIDVWNVYPGYTLIRQTTVAAPPEIPNLDQAIFITPDGGWVEAAMMGGRMNLDQLPGAQASALRAQRSGLGHASEEIWLLEADSVRAELGEETTVKGRPAWTLRHAAAGVDVLRMYDKETGLLLAASVDTGMGTVTQYMSDYRTVGGVLKAFVMESENQGMLQIVKLDSIVVNPEITVEELTALAEGK